MNYFLGLLFPLSAGLFIILGCSIVYILKNSDKFIQFSISMAFGVMVSLLILELFPEAHEIIFESFKGSTAYIVFIFFIILGVGLLKLLDIFIPDHEIEDNNEQSKNENLYHIGLVSSIALILHNIIEGMAIYTTALESTSLALTVTLAVGLHNVPMGLVIASTLRKSNRNKKESIVFLTIITLSTFLGGILMYLMKSYISEAFLGILLCITIGMLIYIVLFELLEELIHSKEKKIMILGLITGIVIFLISLICE